MATKGRCRRTRRPTGDCGRRWPGRTRRRLCLDRWRQPRRDWRRQFWLAGQKRPLDHLCGHDATPADPDFTADGAPEALLLAPPGLAAVGFAAAAPDAV